MKNYIFKAKALIAFTILLFYLLINSCSPIFHQSLGRSKARLGSETPVKKEIMALPAPKEKIVVGVYKFRDQTGQYKPSETGASWSTAVTQGATNILIRALEESGWFIPIERENINNLLNERKIIRASREQYSGNNNSVLPPLLFAGILIEGGITSYETNVYTGGAGVRYFGTDASAQYREDRVSIYLRAVSTSNGKILKTVYTTKSILSQEVSMGVFRYVKFKRLLEAETGYTFNEPTDMAVTEAIEKAIYSLVIEGVLEGLWSMENSEMAESKLFEEYLDEKEDNLSSDYIGRKYYEENRGRFFLGFNAFGQRYNGDYTSGELSPGSDGELGISLNSSFTLNAGYGPGIINIRDVYDGLDYRGKLELSFLLNPYQRYSPYLKAGIGTFYNPGWQTALSDNEFIPFISFGAGGEYLLSKSVSIKGGGFFMPALSDNFDGEIYGNYNDNFWGLEMGIRFYFLKTK